MTSYNNMISILKNISLEKILIIYESDAKKF